MVFASNNMTAKNIACIVQIIQFKENHNLDFSFHVSSEMLYFWLWDQREHL